MTAYAPARVLLADDQHKVRSALRLLIEQESAFCVVAEAQAAEDMMQQVIRCKPDILLLDWELPGLPADGNKLSALRALAPHVHVIALSGKPEARHEAQREGADGFVSKAEPPETLLKALYSVRDKAYDIDRQPAQFDRAV
ncbi:MAG: response regulator transcription factor [Anaerolineae bacterium]|nr:response regulator transcription factor [Thermoflexales bacterium]MDW8396467.1 response regulator transcription factor [Anaerolineae bacterium]